MGEITGLENASNKLMAIIVGALEATKPIKNSSLKTHDEMLHIEKRNTQQKRHIRTSFMTKMNQKVVKNETSNKFILHDQKKTLLYCYRQLHQDIDKSL